MRTFVKSGLVLAVLAGFAAVPAAAYENFIPMGTGYSSDVDSVPAFGSERGQVSVTTDVLETEVYRKNHENAELDSQRRVFQSGNEGLQLMGVRVQRGGKVVLAPTALEVWQRTLQAAELLWTGKSDQGCAFEVLQSPSSLSMLVTGLENYAKTRLREIETEGIAPDASALFAAFSSRAERESDRLAELQTEAAGAGRSVFAVVVDTIPVNFQNFDDLKRAFRASYGIKFGEIGVDLEVVAELRRLIGYRHRVVHVSPLLAFLNQDKVPPEEPVFANRAFSKRAGTVFRSVVDELHKASMAIRSQP